MCMRLFELTSHELIGQAPCPPMFYNAIIDQSPAERLNDLLCKPVGLRLPNEPLNLKATWSMEAVLASKSRKASKVKLIKGLMA